MDDMPTDVAELQARLVKAREEFARLRERDRTREREFEVLVRQRIDFERRAVVAEVAIDHALATLGDRPPPRPLKAGDVYYPPADHPLLVAAAVTFLAAERRRLLLEEVKELCDADPIMPSEWQDVAARITTELEQ
jgi:hypothetical protein